MKKLISLVLVLAMPLLMACGSTKTVAEAAPTPDPASAQSASVNNQPTGEPRWTPPESENSASVSVSSGDSVAEVTEQPASDSEQAFPKVGVPSSQVLEILGKPDRSELGQNSRHLYNDYQYRGILFKSVEVDMTNDGTVWLINLVAEDTTELEDLKAFVQDWADQISVENGTPGVSQFDNPLSLNYDWRDVSLQLATYPGMTEYHIGFFWKLF